jgi:hypothetical protein
MEEFTPPPSQFDTYIPGMLSSQAAGVVGAIRAATFEVVPGDDGSDTLLLRHYWPPVEKDPTAEFQARVLRDYIVPLLVQPRDCVVEIPEREGPGTRRYMLLLMVRDAQQRLRGIGVLVVDCPHRQEAERRLLKLKEMALPK